MSDAEMEALSTEAHNHVRTIGPPPVPIGAYFTPKHLIELIGGPPPVVGCPNCPRFVQEIAELKAALQAVTGGSKCRYTEHHYCYVHNSYANPCPHERARKLLEGK